MGRNTADNGNMGANGKPVLQIIKHTEGVHENIIIIGDPSETDIPDRRSIGDRNA